MPQQPRKVRQAAEEAERLHKEIYGKEKEAEDTPELPEAASATVVTPFEPPKESASDEQQPETPPAEDRENTIEYWKNRALSKEGIDRKVADENRQLREDIANLRGMVTTLTQVKAQQTPGPSDPQEAAPTPAQARGLHLLKPQEIADYGEDLIDVMKRAAREAVSGELTKLERENKRLHEQLSLVQNGVTQQARTGVYGVLQDKVPNWQELNTDPEFLHWLEQRDIYSGVPRGQLLREAFEDNDSARVVAFFESFVKERQTVTPDQAPQAQPAQQGRQPAVAMDTMVAPGKPRGGAAQAQENQKRVWTQAEIHAFYQNVHKGKYRGREKDQRAIEQDIIAATKEGRIRF